MLLKFLMVLGTSLRCLLLTSRVMVVMMRDRSSSESIDSLILASVCYHDGGVDNTQCIVHITLTKFDF